jgi:hypothetical protein
MEDIKTIGAGVNIATPVAAELVKDYVNPKLNEAAKQTLDRIIEENEAIKYPVPPIIEYDKENMYNMFRKPTRAEKRNAAKPKRVKNKPIWTPPTPAPKKKR